MAEPRYRRRKQDRPREITAAAFAAFAEKGYAATRVDDVAKRAGVSKGLLYLYFKTKEELFKAVIKSVVVRRIDRLLDAVEVSELPPEEFIRGPLATALKRIPGSPVSVVVRLLIAEGPRHPDLVDYYWKHVVSKALAGLTKLVERGVEDGSFRQSPISEQPHVFAAPVMFSMIFNLVFSRQPLDSDQLIDTQIDMILSYIRT